MIAYSMNLSTMVKIIFSDSITNHYENSSDQRRSKKRKQHQNQREFIAYNSVANSNMA